MQPRTIGPVKVSAIGPGGMPMSIEGRPDEARSARTIHAGQPGERHAAFGEIATAHGASPRG